MLAPVNYYLLYQELCLFVCLHARKNVVQKTVHGGTEATVNRL